MDDVCDGYNSASKKRRHRDSSNNDDTAIESLNSVTSLQVLERCQNPCFEELASQYKKFRTAWAEIKSLQKERGFASFSSCVTQQFTIELTRALLSSHFRLQLPYLDEHHLCPPVPNRFYYVHWVFSHLLQVQWVRARYTRNNDNDYVGGLDIGAGASCIYGLLTARFFNSTMITSEIDSKSVALANANVKANHLSNMITVLPVKPSYSQQQQNVNSNKNSNNESNNNDNNNNSNISLKIGGPLQRTVETYFNFQQNQPNGHALKPHLFSDFVLTNPPFYDPTSMNISNNRIGDGRQRTNMTVSEGLYPGGEVGFVTEMIEDSLRLANDESAATNTITGLCFTAGWYSSMLGKKTSMVKLQKILIHVLGPAHVETTEFGPGHYTRWFLAWTLVQPPSNATRALCSMNDKDKFQVQEHLPLGTTREIARQEIVDRIIQYCDSSPGGWDLTAINTTPAPHNAEFILLHIYENMPLAVTNFVDETQEKLEIPKGILRVLRDRDNSRFLPKKGHFFVEVKISVARNIMTTETPPNVDVNLKCYSHSARGAKAIEKIRNSLDKEVCRTSRKWRRIRHRQESYNG